MYYSANEYIAIQNNVGNYSSLILENIVKVTIVSLLYNAALRSSGAHVANTSILKSYIVSLLMPHSGAREHM